MVGKLIGVIIASLGIIVAVAFISLLLALPVMWCWNYAVVALFGLKAMTWLQAWCLMLLCNWLIKSNISVSKNN